jgi:hypothetical protein
MVLMSWLLGVLNLVALMGLGIWAIRIANKSAESGRTAARAAVESVDVAKKEVRRRRLEHVGELVIRVYLALGVAPEARPSNRSGCMWLSLVWKTSCRRAKGSYGRTIAPAA